MQDADTLFDTEAGGEHRAELYDAGSIAERMGVQDAAAEAARLHYDEHGWLAVRGLFGPAEIDAALAAVDDLILGRVPGFRGRIYEAAVRNRLPAMSEQERYDAVRKLFRFAAFEPRLQVMCQAPRLLAIVRNLLGCDRPGWKHPGREALPQRTLNPDRPDHDQGDPGSAGRTPRLFQDMALLKPPRIGREKPWHQDHAFFDFSLDTRFLGVWIALDPATLANGCMHVLDRGHLQGPRTHFRRRDVQLCDADVLGQRSVAFPLEPGDAMFFDGLLPHGTPANASADRRRALQFHYCPDDAVEQDSELRLRVFGAEGKDAAC